MPHELLQALPQLSGIVEKLGVVGLLLVAVGWLIYERLRLLKELRAAYRDRDRARLKSERYRNTLTAHDVAIPDVTDIDLQFQGDAT
jgi:hypothetical protein